MYSHNLLANGDKTTARWFSSVANHAGCINITISKVKKLHLIVFRHAIDRVKSAEGFAAHILERAALEVVEDIVSGNTANQR